MKIHYRDWQRPDRFLCGRKRVQIPESVEALCKTCEEVRFVRDRKSEEEQEKLVRAGYLEEDLGPNRQWNEY